MTDLRWAEVARDVVRAEGPDTLPFLQGQLSQDIEPLAVGDSAFALLLQPEGKVEVLLRVTRTGPDAVLLDTDAGWGAQMVERLERFKLRTACELTPLAWRCLAVRGEGAGTVDVPDGAWRVVAETPGVPGVDLLGSDIAPPAGAEPMGAQAYEALRIAAGVPRMGRELDGSTIPAAAGIVDRTVSFTKGCFTGQELVARIDARGGNVPARLCGIVADADPAPPGATVVVDGREAGTVTSAAADPGRGGMVALAYVHRRVEVPADGALVGDGGEVAARILPLPLGPA